MMTCRRFLLSFALAGFLAKPAVAQTITVSLVGTQTLATGTMVGGAAVGGLSGIAYDEPTDRFRAVSDNSGAVGAGRVWTIDLDYDGSTFSSATALSSLQLRSSAGSVLPRVDCEGMAANLGNSYYLSHEGLASGTDPTVSVPPWIWRFHSTTGNKEAEVALPVKFLPRNAAGDPVPPDDATQASGVRSNLSLESLGTTPSRTTLFAANEAALKQDYSGTYNSDTNQAQNSEIRIVRFSGIPRSPVTSEEKVYRADQGTLYIIVRRFNTVSDVLPVGDDGRLLVLERGLTQNDTNLGSYRIRLYQVNFNEAAASNVAGTASLIGASYTRLSKTLVWESSSNMDNVEGLCFGRDVNGFRTLVLVSDNNFSATQTTQFHVFTTNIPATPRYPLNLSVTGSGAAAADPALSSYPAGSEVVLTATPGAGHVFDAWSGSATGSANPLVLTMDAAKAVTAGFITRYHLWARGYFTEAEWQDGVTAAPDNDPERDGIRNLLEYALDLHPRAASPVGLPVIARNGNSVTFTYQKDTAKTDIAYQVEVSSALAGWANLADTFVSATGTVETRRATVPIGSVPQFLRLKITQLF